MQDNFFYERRVAFGDTDAMRVTHHSAYLHYCEEARVAWMRERKLTGSHFPNNDLVLAVLRYQVWHMRPSTFDDLLKVYLQVKREGLKVHFQYVITKGDERICEAETLHITLDKELKPVRMDATFARILEDEKWTETWLSNS